MYLIIFFLNEAMRTEISYQNFLSCFPSLMVILPFLHLVPCWYTHRLHTYPGVITTHTQFYIHPCTHFHTHLFTYRHLSTHIHYYELPSPYTFSYRIAHTHPIIQPVVFVTMLPSHLETISYLDPILFCEIQDIQSEGRRPFLKIWTYSKWKSLYIYNKYMITL